MSNFPQNFERFRLADGQVKKLRSDFNLLLSETDLSRCSKVDRVIADYKRVPAIYFWVMQQKSQLFSVYVGKTNSVSSRLRNYVSDFQPHSPNDYKLRVFRLFLQEVAPEATLDLYFSQTDLADLTQAENLAVESFDPLLNRRQRPSAGARAVLSDAFSLYYRSAFERLLQNDV